MDAQRANLSRPFIERPVATVLLAVAAFSVALTGYYYSTMSSSTISRVSTAVPFFNDTTQSGYYQMANNYINDIFDDSVLTRGWSDEF